jgi:membrane protease YdiL (CAAX protease family)
MFNYLFVESDLYKAIQTYLDATKHRFYEMGHAVLILLVYELLFRLSYNPRVYQFEGVDAWFQLTGVLPGGTLLISFFLIAYWGHLLYLDWIGKKDWKEFQKDRQEKKKNKDFKPKDKSPFRPNLYYFGGQVLEGFVYGSLMIMLLPWAVYQLIRLPLPELAIPQPLDSQESMYPYLTNIVQSISLAFGAGFYEEMIFRSLLFVAIGRAAKQVKFFKQFETELAPVSDISGKIPKYKPNDQKFRVAIAFGTLIYALSHYVLPFGDAFHVYSFLYRFVFGLLMYYIFVSRRLAVAAWTHTFYDLWYYLLS